MVRYCVVKDCLHSDRTTLTHRFPKNVEKWRESLNLLHISPATLAKYSVCCHHFKESDYRHKESNFLNVTAVPMIHVPENERRTKKADEPAAVTRYVTQADAQHRQDIYIELDESGEKMAFQATTKVSVNSVPAAPDSPPEKRIKGESEEVEETMPQDDVICIEDELVTEDGEEEEVGDNVILNSIEIPDELAEEEDNLELVAVPVPEQMDSEDHELREHYANYTKEQLIEFLVKAKVYLQ